MRLKRLGEFGAIERIKSLCGHPGRGVRVGIGDDAAAFLPGPGVALASADMMVEGVHFDLRLASWRELGYKALASNMSDIAAMGGRPRYYLVSAAFRGDEDTRCLEELYAGFEQAAEPHGVRLIGGDTTATPGPRVVAVTILGEAGPKGPVKRSGARPGDDIYVTGTLGDSAGGLELLRTGARAITPPHLSPSPPVGEGCPKGRAGVKAGRRVTGAGEGDEEYLIARHLMPEARVKAGMLLGGAVTSMIDISDGLSSDLGHIIRASSVGARLHADKIPLSGELVRCVGAKRALGLALHGGEDYELLFTAGPRARKKIAGLRGAVGAGVSIVGEITRDKGAYLVAGTGSLKELRPGGYEHFRK